MQDIQNNMSVEQINVLSENTDFKEVRERLEYSCSELNILSTILEFISLSAVFFS